MKYRIIESWTSQRTRVFEVEAADMETAEILFHDNDDSVEQVEDLDEPYDGKHRSYLRSNQSSRQYN